MKKKKNYSHTRSSRYGVGDKTIKWLIINGK